MHIKVLIDGHIIGRNRSGLGRYTNNLTKTLSLHKSLRLYLYKTPSNGLQRITFGFQHRIAGIKPDILHIQNFTPIYKTCPIVNTVHDVCFRYVPNSFSLKSRLAFFFFFKRSLMLSDQIIAVSNSVKTSLKNLYGINPKKISVIYEAADKNFFYIQNKIKVKQTLKDKFRIDNQYFLVVGDSNKRKNIEPIIKAHSLLSKNINLVFVGRKNPTNKINKNIRYLGYVTNEDLNILYNGARGLIMNSFCEGFGLPLVEAMACKTPIICNDIDVFHEICNKSALYTKNANDIAQAMKYLLIKTNYHKYSEYSYKEGKRFSWDTTAKKTISVYNEVLKRHEYTK